MVSVLGKPDSTGKSILILLIESGGLYCCTLVRFHLLRLVYQTDRFQIVYAGFSLSGSAGECVILQVMAQLTVSNMPMDVVHVSMIIAVGHLPNFNHRSRVSPTHAAGRHGRLSICRALP